mgnify:FL=1
MRPVRVTAPVGSVVGLTDLKAHLRVDVQDEDELIQAYEAAAVSHLDGWRGVLGRCILEQEWAVTYEEAGCYRLPFPDVSAVTVLDAADAEVSYELTSDAIGWVIEIEAPATVTMTCAMPSDALNAVKMIVKLMVAHWYSHREAVSDGSFSELPLAVDALMRPLRSVGV